MRAMATKDTEASTPNPNDPNRPTDPNRPNDPNQPQPGQPRPQGEDMNDAAKQEMARRESAAKGAAEGASK